MAGVVKSVETFQVTVGSGAGTAGAPITDTLGESQNIDNCVPFVTKRSTGGTKYEAECYQLDVWFSSTDTLNVARDDTGGASTAEAEVSVVEFDDTLCNVYQGTFQLTSGGGSDFTVTASIGGTVDLSKSFLVFHSLQNGTSGVHYESHCVRGRITSTTQLTFDRVGNAGTCDGHWYVVECIGSEFSVDALSISLSAAQTSNTGAVSVGSATTLLIGSWTCVSTEDNIACTVDVTLDSDTQVTVQRAAADGAIEWSGFAVDFADGSSVQRGTITGQGATASQSVTLTAPVSLARSTAMLSGNMGGTTGGSFPGTEDSDVMDAQVQLTLEDSDTGGNFDTLNVRHNNVAGEADNDISWQVVEWGTGAVSPPRRVMVIT